MPEEFWREVVDRVAAEAPDTLLLAEAFWLMEGYFVRTLGMHRVYNSAFMNMLKMEENAKYRQTHQERARVQPRGAEALRQLHEQPGRAHRRRAVRQGRQVLRLHAADGDACPACRCSATARSRASPRSTAWSTAAPTGTSTPDEDMVRRHERDIFPLMRRRGIFSRRRALRALRLRERRRLGRRERLRLHQPQRRGQGAHHLQQRRSSVRTGGCACPRPSTPAAPTSRIWCAGPWSKPWTWTRRRASGTCSATTWSRRSTCARARNWPASGLHSSLQGYQGRALIDWRAVHDHDGAWARLAAMLQGGGTPDLGRARRRLQLEGELQEVRRWLSPPSCPGWSPRRSPRPPRHDAPAGADRSGIPGRTAARPRPTGRAHWPACRNRWPRWRPTLRWGRARARTWPPGCVVCRAAAAWKWPTWRPCCAR